MFPTTNRYGAPPRAHASAAPPDSSRQTGPLGRKPQTDGHEDTERDKPRALVVDDAPDVTEMIAMLMRFAGYEVTTAFSAPEAIDAARGGRFDVVISDIGMPEMNGYQLAEALRSLPDYERVPLIAVTGFSQFDDRTRALRAGFDDFLAKPIIPNDLLAKVSRLRG